MSIDTDKKDDMFDNLEQRDENQTNRSKENVLGNIMALKKSQSQNDSPLRPNKPLKKPLNKLNKS